MEEGLPIRQLPRQVHKEGDGQHTRWQLGTGAGGKLAAHNYGRDEWWLLLDPVPRGAE